MRGARHHGPPSAAAKTPEGFEPSDADPPVSIARSVAGGGPEPPLHMSPPPSFPQLVGTVTSRVAGINPALHYFCPALTMVSGMGFEPTITRRPGEGPVCILARISPCRLVARGDHPPAPGRSASAAVRLLVLTSPRPVLARVWRGTCEVKCPLASFTPRRRPRGRAGSAPFGAAAHVF